MSYFTVDYQHSYTRTLSGVSSMTGDRTAPLCAFWPMVGRHFAPGRGTVIIGQAVNGWGNQEGSFSAGTLTDQRQIEIIASARQFSESTLDMTWPSTSEGSSDYNTRRSQFWMAAKAIQLHVDPIAPSLDHWSDSIAWSNLYKIAPFEGGNPNTSLREAQNAGCRDLLHHEITVLRPSLVLMMTGWDWVSPFQDALPIEWQVADGQLNLVDRVGKFESTRLIVARHPRGKQHDVFVNEMIKAIGQFSV